MKFINSDLGDLNVDCIVRSEEGSSVGGLPIWFVVFQDADGQLATTKAYEDPSLSGSESYVKADPGFWIVTASDPVYREPVVAWRMQGRGAEPVGLSPNYTLTSDWAVLTPQGQVFTDEGETFETVTAYVQSRIQRLEHEAAKVA